MKATTTDYELTSTNAPTVLREVGIFIDIGDPFGAMCEGDWIATEAGARYIVLSARKVKPRIHTQRNRWQMRCGRLEQHAEIPADVKCWWMTWYPRRHR